MASAREQARPTAQQGYMAMDTKRLVAFLFALRLLNALTNRTFFQPDEYFQSLEPAWNITFGPDSGAWITWEWREYLRSSIHPYIFSKAYKFASAFGHALRLESFAYGELLVATPKVVQALFAALLDLYTVKLSIKHHGVGSKVPTATLLITVLSPWQWFCSTRTLMNGLEAMLTAMALFYWPWKMFTTISSVRRTEANRMLAFAMVLAALASILRAPNVLIWLTLGGTCFLYRLWLWQRAVSVLSRVLAYVVIVGCNMLIWTLCADYMFYGRLVFPPYRFLQFNVVQSLAVFYGHNRRDYYLTEGLPILLTTFLPFAVHGIYTAIQHVRRPSQTSAVRTAVIRDLILILVVLTTTIALTTIPHKEVRFLYPLLPILHLFAARSFASFFPTLPDPRTTPRRALLLLIVAFNIALALFATQIHQRGVVDVTHYLRHQHEQMQRLRLGSSSLSSSSSSSSPSSTLSAGTRAAPVDTTVAFLMPCHSTPWRSHLVHPGIKAWALTCEPPLNRTLEERRAYLDEADRFYDAPGRWVEGNMAPLDTLPSRRIEGATEEQEQVGEKEEEEEEALKEVRRLGRDGLGLEAPDGRKWPMFLVFFDQLRPSMEEILAGHWGKHEGGGYGECWRGFNSFFHDDWRREGDVVVWCLESVRVALSRGKRDRGIEQEETG